MDDQTLALYIPHLGDRIAVKDYCSHPKKTQAEDRKRTLLMSLKKKLSSENDGKHCKKFKHLPGNTNAKKNTRKIELGLLNLDNNVFKQVRTKNGGGTRKIDVDKSMKKGELIDLATSLFFPNGKSKLGSVDDFHFDLRDFSEEVWNANETIGELYQKTGMPLLRFSLSITAKALQVKDNLSPIPDLSAQEQLPSLHSSDEHSSTTSLPDLFTVALVESGLQDIAAQTIVSSDTSFGDSGLHYHDSDVSFNVAWETLNETNSTTVVSAVTGNTHSDDVANNS
ncbi:hypothetical protein KP79_PYT23047 [Mizuhopecten yessoensis]|uniref:Uncharacterized protein n=2 Tax=Mizuhopecten yessoensis TaxID=6573 RepID=A0A210PHE7_MIZYE|nr:hypothetical protein KP79_PYT23047 [Mizuhopecten yessoensis]